jgi:hypothetical protein
MVLYSMGEIMEYLSLFLFQALHLYSPLVLSSCKGIMDEVQFSLSSVAPLFGKGPFLWGLFSP